MSNQVNSIDEISTGAVVYKNQNNQNLFLLGKSSGYHKWILPKGRIEAGETEIETAIREVKEETSIDIKIIDNKPIFEENYIYYANFKSEKDFIDKKEEETRRVKTYQEDGGADTKVNKTVKYFLAEFISGDPINHGWELEDCAWFTLEKALEILEFEGQKKALKKAFQILSS